MQQRNRREKSDGLGYYTQWDKSRENGCIYCGNRADTREHIPSKVLLSEPYPENLPTIPACFECNNGFSADEEYFVSFLETLKSAIYVDYSISDHIVKIFNHTPALQEMVTSSIHLENKTVFFSYDEIRFKRVINKLAVCHAGYEFDHVDFNDPISTKISFIFNMTPEDISEFTAPEIMNCVPEISSRFTSNYCIIQNIDNGEAYLLNDWIVVQEGRYQYYVYLNTHGGVSIKMIILDFLYCQVDFS